MGMQAGGELAVVLERDLDCVSDLGSHSGAQHSERGVLCLWSRHQVSCAVNHVKEIHPRSIVPFLHWDVTFVSNHLVTKFATGALVYNAEHLNTDI